VISNSQRDLSHRSHKLRWRKWRWRNWPSSTGMSAETQLEATAGERTAIGVTAEEDKQCAPRRGVHQVSLLIWCIISFWILFRTVHF